MRVSDRTRTGDRLDYNHRALAVRLAREPP
jgi:hypothetical protein